MANTLSVEQSSALLGLLLQQAKGGAVQEVNTSNFVAVGTTLLQSGYDNLLNCISQVLTRTYFSIRPYTAKFGGLYVTEERFGAYTRKLTAVDKDPMDNAEYYPENGASADMFLVDKTEVLQLNFYGAQTYSRVLNIWKNQLDAAFSSPEELGRFWAMLYQNLDDMVQQDRETMARAALTNFIGGKIAANNGVVKLVTVYNDMMNPETPLDVQTVRRPGNWEPFCRWMFGYIKTLSNQMTERSTKYHINVEGKEVSRHTPLDRQKVYLLDSESNIMDSTVLSTTYHTQYLDRVDFESVAYWQSLDTPAAINVVPSYMGADGMIKTAGEAVTADVFGVIFDEDAIACTIVNVWSASTPMNSRTGLVNDWHHYTLRWQNDFSENGLVLLLE